MRPHERDSPIELICATANELAQQCISPPLLRCVRLGYVTDARHVGQAQYRASLTGHDGILVRGKGAEISDEADALMHDLAANVRELLVPHVEDPQHLVTRRAPGNVR